MSEIKKFIRDGKVAVIYHEGLGIGWYTYYERMELLFSPELVEMILTDKFEDIVNWSNDNRIINTSIYEAKELRIKWVPQGQRFKIVGCDGDEEIITIDDLDMEA